MPPMAGTISPTLSAGCDCTVSTSKHVMHSAICYFKLKGHFISDRFLPVPRSTLYPSENGRLCMGPCCEVMLGCVINVPFHHCEGHMHVLHEQD